MQNELQPFFSLIEKYIQTAENPETPVLRYKKPKELKQIIDFGIHPQGEGTEGVMNYIRQYLEYTSNSANHQFFNQLFGGLNLPAFMGDIVSALTNTTIATYEVAPVGTLIETSLIEKMCHLVGYTYGDGIFVTGGSNSNMIAMFSARNKLFGEIKQKGLSGFPVLTAFISDQAHYSFENNANILGIGSGNVYKIKSDERGRMIPSDLERQIQISKDKGEMPFFIAATAGTTFLTAFDPIQEIADIGIKRNIWVHVDGAYGGSLILSSKNEALFRGISKTNSFTWDPHKLMNIPLVCSVILINEPNRLKNNLTDLNDDYLFHESETASCDLGKKSVQCGRRVEALKLWLAWKYYGDEGYAARMDNLMAMAEYFEACVMSDERLELVIPRQTLSVCFRLRVADALKSDEINLAIREEMRMSGKTLVNFGYWQNQLVIRWLISNADSTKTDIDIFFRNFWEVAEKYVGE